MNINRDYIYRHLKQFDLIKEIGCFVVSKIKPFGTEEFKTILITRFNYGNNPKGLDENYLDGRIEIFDKYTFPSVNAQTDCDFDWIILLNSKTPQKYKDILEQYKTKAKMNLSLIWVEPTDKSLKEIAPELFSLSSVKYVLTCRCDNDDIVAKNYIEEMKKNFRPIHNMYIDFIYGYSLDISKNILNTYRCKSNHFIGYVENLQKRKLQTVYNFDHSMVKLNGWVRRIKNKTYPLWCEISHSSNIVNKLNGEKSETEDIEYFKEKFIENYTNTNNRIIVSLTSYPKRIDYVGQAIESIINQTHKADLIILWLAKEQFPNLENDLPNDLVKLKEKGLIINWCEDIKSYKKLIPSLIKYPNDIIVTADDDVLYEKDWLEKLYNAYLQHPNMINTHRAHRILFKDGEILPYNKWCHCVEKVESSYNNFLTSGGGVLFPPNCFHKEVINEKLFLSLCPTADDIWFWAMSVLNNTKINVITDNYGYPDSIDGSQSESLNSLNVDQNKNDEQLKNIFEHYPELLEKLDKSPFKNPNDPTFWERIFSVKQIGKKNILRILGIKITFLKGKKMKNFLFSIKDKSEEKSICTILGIKITFLKPKYKKLYNQTSYNYAKKHNVIITECPKATGTFRLLQLTNLEVLKYIHKICVENNLVYWLAFGTLLGAVRHKGFIPWDDDIDIAMPRNDYNKLINFWDKYSNNYEGFYLERFTYYERPKLREILKIKNKDCKLAWVDIFPVDNWKTELSDEEQIQITSEIQHKRKQFLANNFPDKNEFLDSNKRFLFFEQMNKVIYGNRNENCGDYLYGLEYDYYQKNIFIKKDNLFPLQLVPFEDCCFYVPRNIDPHLKNIYGDYMQYPKHIPTGHSILITINEHQIANMKIFLNQKKYKERKK